MQATAWTRGPVGIDMIGRVTRNGCKTVLVLVPTMTAGTRLLDLLPVLDGDHRVQVVFTMPSSEDVWHGLDGFVRDLGALVLPWDQARRHNWDLVLSASHDCIEHVHGKLLLLPHGAGAGKSRKRTRTVTGGVLPTTGLDRQLLTRRGQVIPATIALPTEADQALLRRTCAEAVPRSLVVGDICLDRIMASVVHRSRYRAALGVGDQDELITISSTWSPESVFGKHIELYERLVVEAAHAQTKVAAVLHPNIWAVHGRWQVRSWLARATARGLLVIPPERGWQATVIASDIVIGDHGSTSAYAGALGGRMCLAAFPDHNIRAGSVGHTLGRFAPRLDPDAPLRPQLDRVRARPGSTRLREAISARPGMSHRLLRTAMYRLLDIPEPPWPVFVTSAPIPIPLDW
ncbi:hypothetical protein [Actinokineospora iranica]|uniref:CDP-Glycerol:Poly(Glycerophosphate) glycerophosphotransferase n=1 Tax=Actinokineospora iranica TaxID=1271860 RepID=A0A1G6TNQ2_9PSEU|nr:hypothetical protein [Actinokineospora iranica]SDD29965.1 hypothetical protein SAMN05216174_109207 [Actinokineospora iranica]